MTIKTTTTCPLGSQCEQIVGETLHRCAWLVTLAGTNPTTGETVDEQGCAIAWMPVLLIENSKQQRSTAAAVESFRNEMVKANENEQILLFGSNNPSLINKISC